MRNFIYTLFALAICGFILAGCGSNATNQPENQPVDGLSDDVAENNTVPPSLSEIFASVPDEYCYAEVREPVLIYDEENYYIKAGDDLSQPGSHPSFDNCEFTIFKNLSGGNDVYGITKATSTPMLIFSETNFLEYQDGEWTEVTDQVLSLVDQEKLLANSKAVIEKLAPELIDEQLEENCYIELPRYGTTLKFIQYNTGGQIYGLTWNGSDFAVEIGY
ncbi:MAG: hypothetical protein ABIH78_00810 [Candidatus Peregrinibacteria bacterium]